MTDQGKRAKSPTAPMPPRTITPERTPHPIGTPHGLSTNAGMLAGNAWLISRGVYPPNKPWQIEIALDAAHREAQFTFCDTIDTRFHMVIASNRWGYFFCHGARSSDIRITDIPAAHGRDEHHLLAATPPLKGIGAFVRDLEQRYHVHFERHQAAIRSSIGGAEPMVRAWLASL